MRGRSAPRDSEGAAGDRHRGGAGRAGRERARSRRGAALSHHCRAQPARPGASGSLDRSQADRDRCWPRRSWATTARTRCSARSAARWTIPPIRSSTACASRWRRRRERIFRLLKILYPQYDMHSAYVGLQSADPVVHDNAVEFMDSVLPPEVRALIIPLFDRDVTVAAAHRHRQPDAGLDARRSRGGDRGDGAERGSVAARVRGLRDGRDAPDALRRRSWMSGRTTTAIRCCAPPRSMRGRNCATPRPPPPASTRSELGNPLALDRRVASARPDRFGGGRVRPLRHRPRDVAGVRQPALEQRGLRRRELQPHDHPQHDVELADRERERRSARRRRARSGNRGRSPAGTAARSSV